MDGMEVSSSTNQMLTIAVDAANGMVSVNGATVGPADLIATNGVIHVIDQVLLPLNVDLPPDLVDTAIANGNFETLVTALTMAELVGALKEGIFTVFAPTDAAFAALPAGVLDALLADVELLKEVLLYHVSVGEVSEIFLDGQEISTTLEGRSIIVSVTTDDAATVVLNGGAATVVEPSNAVVALNGVIYAIDQVLIPPGLVIPLIPQNLEEVALANGLDTLYAAAVATGQIAVFSQPAEWSK